MRVRPDLPRDDTDIDPTRRRLFQASGLVVAFAWLGSPDRAGAMMSARSQSSDGVAALNDGNPAFAPNAFVRIDPTGPIRLVMPSVEMGQAIYTGASMLLAEELGVGLDQIVVEHAPANLELYGNPLIGGQITGGSTSIRGSWQVLREAGAIARTQLVNAAATHWHVAPSACVVNRGVVSHAASNRVATFGSLVAAAAKLPNPDKVQLKQLKDHVLIGRPMRRVDSPDKVRGATVFGIDVRLPGMKVATVRACPVLGGRLRSLDDRQARTVPGVVTILRIENAVAVVGENFWAAKKGSMRST